MTSVANHLPAVAQTPPLLSLDPLIQDWPAPVAAMVRRPLQSLLGLNEINRLYYGLPAHPGDPRGTCDSFLQQLGISVAVSKADLDRIPKTGPILVVANHPFGAAEALILGSTLLSVRPDTKMLANYMLSQIPEMKSVCIFVDPFDNASGRAQNLRGMGGAVRWLEGGGALGVFPSGEVAHLNMRDGGITEPAWKASIARMARRTGATVVPVYFDGANSALFQLAGLIHPLLRTALLPRELLNKDHQRITLRIGTPITPRRMAAFDGSGPAISYLRLRTYALGHRPDRAPQPRPGFKAWRRAGSLTQSIAPAVPPHQLEHDIAQLPPSALLATSGDLSVYEASAQRIPNLMTELGRLREVTFRAVGEGTGRAIDLDRFDRHYRHLLLWNASKRELVGGYRIGQMDRITRLLGKRGLYLSTLFDLDDQFLRQLGPALELGRSFVRAEYQKSYTPLMLLWKGVGGFVSRRPHYRYMLGPVSISGAYQPASRSIISQYLMDEGRRSPLSRNVNPRFPFDPARRVEKSLLTAAARLIDVEEIAEVVSDIEPDGKGMPVLLRQYLKLGAKPIAMNVDASFGDCVDCLCVVDMLNSEQRSMRRYFGDENFDKCLAVLRGPSPAPAGV